MVKTAIRLAVALLLSAAVHGQFGPAPTIQEIFFSVSGTSPGPGLPLAGGYIFSCQSGTSCPGTPLATFSDSSGVTANQNPITLSANGTPVNGSSPVGIFLNCSLAYKFVVEDANNVVVSVTDGVSCAGTSTGGGGSSTNYWSLSGSTISNNNGSGAGTVNVGSNFNVGANATVQGTLGFADTESTPVYAYLRAPNTMVSTTTWRLPKQDAAGCLVSDGSGNLSFTACSGGGGGGSGTPAGPNNAIQTNAGSGSFGGDGNLLYVSGNVVLGGTGFMQSVGGFVALGTAANVIQAPNGGFLGGLFTWAEQSAPSNSNSGQATMYADSSAHLLKYSENGANYFPIATTTGTLTNGHCVSINGSGQLVDAGGACTTGGGGGTVSTGTQYQVGYYTSSGTGTTIGGNAGLTFSPASHQISTTADILTTGGYNIGSSTQFFTGIFGNQLTTTSLQITNSTAFTHVFYIGEDSSNNLSFTNGLNQIASFNTVSGAGTFTMFGSVVPNAAASGSLGSVALPWSTTYTNALNLSGLTGSTQCLQVNTSGVVSGTGSACGSGGGGGSPVGPNTAVQFNNSGSFGGSANLEYNGTTLYSTGTSGVEVMRAIGGYIGSDGGVNVYGSCTSYTCIQTPSGGVYAKSIRSINYTGTGNSTGPPSATTGDTIFPAKGDMYFDNGSSVEKLWNGSGWISIATGGIPTLNSLSGALNITNGGQSDAITVSASGTTIALTLPQAIGTTDAVQYGSLFLGSSSTAALNMVGGIQASAILATSSATSAIQTTSGGISSALGFSTANTALNSIQTAGNINACNSGGCSGGNAISIAGAEVATNTGYWIGGLNVASGTNVVTIGASGNFYTRPISGTSTSITTCGSTGNGWLAVTTADNYIVMCLAGSRYRVALSPY